MDDVAEKLSSGEALTTKELLEYLPALKEVPATLLEKGSLGSGAEFTAGVSLSVLETCRNGEKSTDSVSLKGVYP